MAVLYNSSNEKIFKLSELFIDEYSFSAAERAFIAYIQAGLAHKCKYDCEEIMSFYKEYIDYKKAFEDAPAESLRLSTVGLEVCTNESYFINMDIIGFCAFCQSGNFSEALKIFSTINMNEVNDYREDFIMCILNSTDEIFYAAIERMTIVQYNIWVDEFLNCILESWYRELDNTERISELLGKFSIENIENWFFKRSDDIDKDKIDKICRLAKAFGKDNLSFWKLNDLKVQEIYIYSRLFKLKYNNEKCDEKKGRNENESKEDFLNYVLYSKEFASLYYDPEYLQEDAGFAVEEEYRASCFIWNLINSGLENSQKKSEVKKAINMFPDFKDELLLYI